MQFQLISSASYAYNDSIWNNPVLTQLLTTTTSAASSSNWRNITDVDKKWPSAFNSCYNHLMQGMTLGPFDIADVEMSQVPALLIEVFTYSNLLYSDFGQSLLDTSALLLLMGARENTGLLKDTQPFDPNTLMFSFQLNGNLLSALS